jgi:hypothetical protein
MRALRADYTKFIADYKDALSCDLHFKEFLHLAGISHFVLNDRLQMLARRGISLPKLKGMRRRPLGIKPGQRNGRKKAARPAGRVEQQVVRAARPMPQATDATFVICVGG